MAIVKSKLDHYPTHTSVDWKADLAALIDDAEAAGKWLYSPSQNLWFSPRQLREQIGRPIAEDGSIEPDMSEKGR